MVRCVIDPERFRFDIQESGMQPPRIFMLKVDPEMDVRVRVLVEKRE